MCKLLKVFFILSGSLISVQSFAYSTKFPVQIIGKSSTPIGKRFIQEVKHGVLISSTLKLVSNKSASQLKLHILTIRAGIDDGQLAYSLAIIYDLPVKGVVTPMFLKQVIGICQISNIDKCASSAVNEISNTVAQLVLQALEHRH